MKLLLATRNPGKVRELRALLAGLPVEVVTAAQAGVDYTAEETGETFAENAVIKAEALCRASGLAAVADDSGLEVDALGGRPGVRSARFAGEQATDAQNNEKLLALMSSVPDERRGARFVSAVALAVPGRPTRVAEGVCHGFVGRLPRGGGGFGYDPLFVCRDPDQEAADAKANGLTYAEMTDDQKNRISHRARAMRGLREMLEAELRSAAQHSASGY